MAEGRIHRKLAAIMAADVVGYSRLMGADETGTLAALKELHATVIDPIIAGYRGRMVKLMGDGMLIEFASVVDAIECAIDLQRRVAERNAHLAQDARIVFRVGVNVGDVIIEGDDIYGDGVNAAARLEGLAEPGGICLSRAAREQIQGKLDLELEDWGEVEVKNMPRPLQVFHMRPDNDGAVTAKARSRPKARRFRLVLVGILTAMMVVGLGIVRFAPWETDVEAVSVDRMAFPLPDKPSLAVLPLINNSADKDQGYFADGITEDIITEISKVSGIFVVASNSSFSFKDKAVEPRQVAEELGVRYILAGSVRRAGSRLRITVQLIDAIKGNHVWADQYDRDVTDIFAVQSEVTENVVKSLAVTLKANEVERLYRRHTTNIEAYELFLRARSTIITPSPQNVEYAGGLFERVIELDPHFAGGYAGLSFNHSISARFQFGASPEPHVQRSLELARKAVEVDPEFAWSYIALGGAHLANGDPVAAMDAVRQALVIQPSGYEENLFTGFYSHFAGQSALAVQHLEIADRISPVDTARKLSFLAMAYFMNEDYDKSVEVHEKRLRNYPVGNPGPYVYYAAALAALGRTGEAAEVARKFLESYPDFHLADWSFARAYKLPQDRDRLLNAARAAGIPD